MVQATNYGPLELSWHEIHAYSETTKAIRGPWECRMIRKMSNSYLAGLRVGEDDLGIPPWSP